MIPSVVLRNTAVGNEAARSSSTGSVAIKLGE
jgi:hypothetical protein